MSYPGGKSGDGVYQKIINQIPPHEVYIEPFLGGGAIMRLKKPARLSIGVDIDRDVVRDFVSVLPGALVVCGDAISWLRENWNKFNSQTFIYFDPPYLLETRKSKRPLYQCEFSTREQHQELLSLIFDLPCMVAISGYWSSLYESSLQGWRSISFNARTRGGSAVEWLWMNYPVPLSLHDYSFLGDNFREREKISRQRKRWLARLGRMSSQQFYAMSAAIAEYVEGGHHRQK